MKRIRKQVVFTAMIMAMTFPFAVSAYAADGWQKDDSGQWTYYKNETQVKKQWISDDAGHWFYLNSKGIMVKDAAANVDGTYYLFDENGYMQSGGWCSISKTNASTGAVSTTWYYADAEGKLYVDGWKKIGDAEFYFNKDGRVTRGGVVTVGEQKYYVDYEKGRLGVGGGWFLAEAVRKLPTDAVRKTWYYAEGEDGSLFYDGWKTIDGAQFYFGKGGNATRGGLVTMEDKKYYIDADKGCLGVGGGWFSVDTTDAKGTTTTRNYYANTDASLLYDGWYVVDGVRQYFDKNCVNYKNRWFTLNDQKIYVDETGAQQQPGWFSVSGVNAAGAEYTNWYYLSAELNIPSEGFHEIDGHIYYFDKSGLNYRKRWYVDGEKNRYYLDENGYLQNNGWFSISTTNANTGAVSTTWYYANTDGICLRSGYHDIDGKTYYFSDNGGSFRKRWLVDSRKRRQYFNDEGYMERNSWFATESIATITGPAVTELSEEEITTTKLTWYYADENGYTVAGDNITIGDQEYKLNANGSMFTGWERIKGYTDYYYYKEDGSKAYGWQLITNPDKNETIYNMYTKYYGDLVWFYFNPNANGRMVHSASGFGEQTIDGRIYCTNKRGMIQYGWVSKNGGDKIQHFCYYMPVETGGVSSVTLNGNVDGNDLHQQGKDGYLPGQKVADKWVWTEAAYQMPGTDKSATWYYIRSDGVPEYAAANKIQLKNINGYHAFDPYGRTYSGFGYQSKKDVTVGTVYYFDVENYNTAVTGIKEIELNGVRETFRFNNNGEGVTGVYDGYLYYKGRRQTGSGVRGVTYVLNEEKDTVQRTATYLVDEAGKVVPNANNLESNGAVWSSDASGNVTRQSTAGEMARTVAEADMSVFIGDMSE